MKRGFRGFTLVEMLIVVTITMILVAAGAMAFRPANDSRRIREAARAVNVYLSSVRNRAMETGKPCGVIFERFSPALPCAMVLQQCEVPPCYAGDTTEACAMLLASEPGTVNVWLFSTPPTLAPRPQPMTIPTGDSLPSKMIRVGDSIQFGHQGPMYTITGHNGTTDADGFFNADMTQLVCTHPNPGQAMPWWTVIARDWDDPPLVPGDPPISRRAYSPQVPYRIFRSPMKSGVSPLQLPSTIVVDLDASGVDGGVYFNPTPAGDVSILFAPNGSIESVYVAGSKYPTVQPIFLLIGSRERIGLPFLLDNPNESTMTNYQNLNNLWVTINPQTGMIGTEVVGSEGGVVIADVTTSRELARSAIGIGGR